MPPRAKVPVTTSTDMDNRLYQMNKFIQEICVCPYLVQSKEFRQFTHNKQMKFFVADIR